MAAATALDVLGVPTVPPPRGQGSPWRVGSTSAGRASDLWPGRGLEREPGRKKGVEDMRPVRPSCAWSIYGGEGGAWSGSSSPGLREPLSFWMCGMEMLLPC